MNLEITCIPEHAWFRSFVDTLLAPFCETEGLAPGTHYSADKLAFLLSTWALNPDVIPCAANLFLPKADVVLSEAYPACAEWLALHTLRHPVKTFVTHYADFRRPVPLPIRSGRRRCWGR